MNIPQKPCTWGTETCIKKKKEQQLQAFEAFFRTYHITLNPENRWIKLAQMIPWWAFEEKYAKQFKKSKKGERAYSVRVALGALIV